MNRHAIWVRAALIRAALIYAALVNGSVGVWATLAPRNFYDKFPGFGRVWVAVDGPYNEHLVRDVGALGLALTVVVLVAAWTMTRPLLLTAGAALTVASLPHTIYHFRHADVYAGAVDKVASLGGLVLVSVLSIYVLLAARSMSRLRT